MKKILFAIILLGLLCLCGTKALADGTGASGNDMGWQVISSTGITVINFDRITNEIYVVNYTTQSAYVNWISTTPVNTNFLLINTSRTEEIQSSKMSIDLGATPPVNIRVQYKFWRP